MPFRSDAQRRWMFANEPAMAHRWASYGGGGSAMSVNVKTDISSVSDKLRVFKRRAPKVAHNASVQMATDLVKAVQLHASGRPGPNVITGAYRASIQISGIEDGANATTSFVSTSAPQAHRLEFGFVGTDRLGRHYHQPAFPHWRPGLQDIAAQKNKYKTILGSVFQ